MTEVQVEMPVSEFLTAGLEPEGIYRLRVHALTVQERTVKSGDRQGEKYKTIAGQFDMVEQFGSPEEIEYPTRAFINFSVSGRGLERFRKFYNAALGPVPEGDPGQTITLNDLAAALVGNEDVWTTYFWKRHYKNPEDLEGSLGYSFAQDPSTLQAPQPFAARDND